MRDAPKTLRNPSTCAASSLDTPGRRRLPGPRAAAHFPRAPPRSSRSSRWRWPSAPSRWSARARDVIHLEIGEPDFPPPPAAVAACSDGAARRRDPLHRQPRPRRPARGHRREHSRRSGARRRSGAGDRDQRHVARDAAGLLAAARARRRGDARDAALPLLSELHPLLRRRAGAGADGSRARLPARSPTPCARAMTPRTRAIVVELAGEPDRGDPERRDAARPRGARDPAGLRRDLRRARLRRRARHVRARGQRARPSCSTASPSATR